MSAAPEGQKEPAEVNMKKLVTWCALVATISGIRAVELPAAPLRLIAKYPMPASAKGRFDHLGVDVSGNRLFLAAESAHEVLVFNLGTGKFVRSIPGIEIPHAIFSREDLDRIYVTDGGAGEVKIYDGKNYRLLRAVKLKVDSDSIGYDPATRYLYVDNGGGDANETFSMLSAVNTTTGQKVGDLKLDGDTLEAMALAKSSPLLYVNNPAKNQVDVVNRQDGKLAATWPVTACRRNVAMALDEAAHRLFLGCRSGAVVVLDTRNGQTVKSLPIPQGVDDLIFDAASKRLYASCGVGGGSIAVYREDDPDHYTSLGDVPSAPGGKNEVLVPQVGKLFVTIPPREGRRGEVYVYKTE
jgi:DNA-binding beta-propeller fold protein YncE